jgi:CheY-like chemotaxis protein
MDIQMPVMDGMAATRQIRSPEHPAHDVPVIAMTANVLPQQVAAFRAAGMNDHIGKPFKRDELYAAVARWAGKRSDLPQDVAAVA